MRWVVGSNSPTMRRPPNLPSTTRTIAGAAIGRRAAHHSLWLRACESGPPHRIESAVARVDSLSCNPRPPAVPRLQSFVRGAVEAEGAPPCPAGCARQRKRARPREGARHLPQVLRAAPARAASRRLPGWEGGEARQQAAAAAGCSWWSAAAIYPGWEVCSCTYLIEAPQALILVSQGNSLRAGRRNISCMTREVSCKAVGPASVPQCFGKPSAKGGRTTWQYVFN
eukprot:363291-Chlamydomonas_euryale.AAC.1